MKFSTTQWIAWFSATLVAAVTLTAFAYQNFETKQDAQEKKSDIIQRLDRIENMLVALLHETRK